MDFAHGMEGKRISLFASIHTLSKKCLLTLPLNGWKPESRISAESELNPTGECGLVLTEAKWPFMRFDVESMKKYEEV